MKLNKKIPIEDSINMEAEKLATELENKFNLNFEVEHGDVVLRRKKGFLGGFYREQLKIEPYIPDIEVYDKKVMDIAKEIAVEIYDKYPDIKIIKDY